MKAVLFFVFVAIMMAFAFAQANNNPVATVCNPVPFNLSHNSTQIVLIPGHVSLYFGYQVTIMESSAASEVSIQGASITFSATCQGGGKVTFNSPLTDQTYMVPANPTNTQKWSPSELYMSGFQSGPVTTNPVCGNNVGYAITGAVFNAGLLQTQNTNAVYIRFTYFVNINTGLSSPLPGTISTGGDISIWLGNSAYSPPKGILGPICNLLTTSGTNSPSASISGSVTGSSSVSTSVSVTGSTTTSETAQMTCTNPRRCVGRTTILGSPRKYLRRD